MLTTVIFDIDGTLVESFQFDDECYSAAAREVLGDIYIHDDWSKYHNVTDTGILQQILQENQIEELGQQAKIRTIFGESIQHYIEQYGCSPTPGAVQLLEQLSNESSFNIGIATGGWRHTAEMKLRSAGFQLSEVILASSDDHYERTAIMQHCLGQLGQTFERIVYVGDGEWDVLATQQLGWHFIGIGPRVKGKCEHWLEDFSEHALFMKMLYA